jgi:glutamate synthase domain-containing protein 1
MDRGGRRFDGKDIIRAMANMRERGNGLGGGFAVYGLYPDYRDYYAFHLMYENTTAKRRTEEFLAKHFNLHLTEEIPTNNNIQLSNPPLLWRYFLQPKKGCGRSSWDDYVLEKVMTVNNAIEGAFVFSSGRDMGVFKGVGYPEDAAEYFCLEEYEGYMWTAHGRFPTNTPGWWGGAQPFSVLDWAVVHNGEISSYGTNRRYLEMYRYLCTMHTDTEVLVYALDLLRRVHGLPLEVVSKVFAPPFWFEIDRMERKEKELYTALRQVYGSLLMNGPFTVIFTSRGEMVGLTDRIKLRPLCVGVKDDLIYMSSEEAAIRLVCPSVERCWRPKGGELVVGRLRAQAVEKLLASSEV